MRGKVTKRTVDALKPRATTFCLRDNELSGFAVRVTPQGVKSYVLEYKFGGQSRRVTIGRHGSPWTPATARAEAMRLLVERAAGRDPALAREADRRAEAFSEFAKRYLREHAAVKKKLRSSAEDARLLEKVILPKLGRRRLDRISRQDVARLHYSLRGTPYQANRALALVSKMLNLAERWGLRPDGSNPCRYVEKYREHHRERFLSADELQRLGEVLAEASTLPGRADRESPAGKEDPEPWQAIAAIRLLLFTGCRVGEILRLEWRHVDRERGYLNLPDSKTGAKAVPLAAPAIDVLDALPRVDDSPYVLPGGRGKGHFVGVPHAWARLRVKAGLADVRLHDLRHTFASVGAASGESLVIIGALLGHRQPSTTARYAHLAPDPVRAAGERIAVAICSSLGGKAAGKVVPFRRGGRS